MNAPAARHRPFVLINMAMTADGKVATADRRLASFGSARDHRHLLELRATADAVMCGARTVDSEPIDMGPGPARYRRLRLQRGLAEYNLRVIVSGSGTVNPRAKVFRHRFSPILLLTSAKAGTRRLAQLRGLTEAVHASKTQPLDLAEGLDWLHRDWGVRRLVCEGGGTLNFALLSADLVDELHLTICPRIFGGSQAPTLADGDGFRRLEDASRLELTGSQRAGDELFLVYRVVASDRVHSAPAARPLTTLSRTCEKVS